MQDRVSNRLHLTQAIVEVYSRNLDVLAIGCCGSVARNSADRLSDIDFYVFWSRLTSESLEPAPLSDFAGERFAFTGVDENFCAVEQYFVEGVKVDLAHEIISAQDAVFDRVLVQHEIAADLFKNLAAIAELLPLYGDEVIARIVSRASSYPTDLQEKCIEKFLLFPPTSLMEICLLRDDRLGFYSYLVQTAGHAVSVIAALNCLYFHPNAELKGAMRLFDRTTIKPANLANTLLQLFESPSMSGLEKLRGGLGELLNLVEEHFPNVSTERARWRLNVEIQSVCDDQI